MIPSAECAIGFLEKSATFGNKGFVAHRIDTARGFGLGVFDLKTQFHPRRDIGPRVGARTHTRRAKRQRSITRSEGANCADGLSWHNRTGEANY